MRTVAREPVRVCVGARGVSDGMGVNLSLAFGSAGPLPPSPLEGEGRGEARGVRGLTTSDGDQ
jgi:hypothetical protein